jgi:hypothetical protein
MEDLKTKFEERVSTEQNDTSFEIVRLLRKIELNTRK